jgi:hypothetical protein
MQSASVMLTRFRSVLTYLFLTFFLFLFIGPLSPGFISEGLDSSWGNVLEYAFPDKLVFGKDIVFTFGPLGFLFCNLYYPHTYIVELGFMFAIAAFISWTLIKIGRSLSKSLILQCLLFLPVAMLLGGGFQDAIFFGSIFIIFVGYVMRPRLPRENMGAWSYLASLFLAIIALVKFSFFIPCTALAILITANEFRQKKIPSFLFTYIAALLMIWFSLYRSLAAIPHFLAGSFDTASGFASAMSAVGDQREINLFLIFAVGAIAFVSFLGRQKIERFINTSFVFFFLFLIFKASYVRQDSHAYLAALVCPVVVILIYAWAKIGNSSLGIQRTTSLILLTILACANLNRTIHVQGGTVRDWMRTYLFETKSSGLINLLHPIESIDLFQHQHELGAESIGQKYPFIKGVVGSADIYPFNQSIVLAATGLQYKPRPMLQSYSAYTVKLAEMNANYLRGESAPDTIFFEVATIDGRYPSLDDGASWPELLSRYELSQFSAGYLVLKKKQTPTAIKFTEIFNGPVKFGAHFTLPESQYPIWAEIRVRETLFAKALKFIFKLPSVRMKVDLSSGEFKDNRIILPSMAAGFLLSPYISDSSDFLPLLKDQTFEHLKLPKVITATFDGPNSEKLYKDDELDIKLYALKRSE